VPRNWIWTVAKVLQGLGLVLVLVGLVLSVQLGMQDEGMESMRFELYGLVGGGLMFAVGVLLERSVGR